MSEPREEPFVLGPLFTLALALALYGLVRRRRAAFAAAGVAVAADRLTKLRHGSAPRHDPVR